MIYFWGALGWIWGKRIFIAVTLASAILFSIWFFPFDDLSDLVTSKIAQVTGNQVYLQFESMDIGLFPSPALSASNVSIETPTLPAIEATWLKIAPSWLSFVFNPLLLKRAAEGDAAAMSTLQTKIGGTIKAEGILGADVDLRVASGTKSEGGIERSKVSLMIENVSLAQVKKWAELSVNIQGSASISSTFQFTPGFVEQPDGEYEIHINKFNLPAATVMVPFGGALMPINIPTLTLQNVLLKGRLVGGSLIVEEGTFGQKQDPINGRLKGQVALRLQQMGGQIIPLIGAYNLTLDFNTTKKIEKDMSFAFILFDSAKTATSAGSRYLFRAQGNGLGPPPSISRINSF